jgi:hypothetical protein
MEKPFYNLIDDNEHVFLKAFQVFVSLFTSLLADIGIPTLVCFYEPNLVFYVAS